MTSSYYQTLGIPPNATAEEIKSAWRSIAFAEHPDRNNGKESQVLKDASAAWDVLSDPAKRRSYDAQLFAQDSTLANSVNASGDHPFQGDVFNILFEEMARMRTFFGEHGDTANGKGHSWSYVKPHPILKTVTIPLADAFTRPDVEVPIRRWRMENGVRIDEDAVLMVQVPLIDSSGKGTVIVEGVGHVVSPHGKGDVKIAFNLRIPEGITLRGEGTVECIWTLTLKEALAGFNITFDHPNGRQYSVASKEGIVPPGHKHVLVGHGLEHEMAGRGDFILVFNVEFPQSIPVELKAAVQQWL